MHFMDSSKKKKMITPPKFNSSPLKNDCWEMILSFWVSVTFQGRTVSFREGIPPGLPFIMFFSVEKQNTKMVDGRKGHTTIGGPQK